MKLKFPYSNQQYFRDITKEKGDVVEATRSLMKDLTVKVYECKGTAIIFSQNDKSMHASLSNEKRPVKEWEVGYAIARILKVKTKDVDIFTTENNIIHLHCEKEESLLN